MKWMKTQIKYPAAIELQKIRIANSTIGTASSITV